VSTDKYDVLSLNYFRSLLCWPELFRPTALDLCTIPRNTHAYGNYVSGVIKIRFEQVY